MARLAAPLCILLVAALLAACADKPLAPIEDRTRGGTSRVEQRYTVLRGDTLFSIAFRYGLDFRRLAAANAIASPYTIYPGQTLRLAEAEPPPPAAKSSPTTVAVAPTSRAVESPKTAQSPSARKASENTGSQPPVTATPTPKPKPSAKPKASAGTPAVTNVRVSAWRWPATGKVVRRFDKNLHKGVDISGSRGDAVQATASGRVVYAGSGIAGYGLMLIVRHNDEYLSAYGHNDALLVGEGDVVRAGQKIAKRGSSGTDAVKLHFEIRRQGRPVDPLTLLPAR